MLTKSLSVTLLVCFLIIVRAACQSSGASAPALPTSTSEPAIREALIDSIDVQISESMLVQINVIAHGHLTEACAQLSDVKQRYESHEFQITIFSTSPSDRGCAQVATPFEKVIPLDVANLPAGVYTVVVNGVRGSFQLAADSVPPAAPMATPTAAPPAAAASGSINGWLWHDLCAVSSEGGPIKPSVGCVQDGLLYHANGIRENGEPPIGGVKVRLGAGECPSGGLKETTTITTDLSYSFTGLYAGTYCVAIDPLQEGNGWNLLPGSWTYPASVDGPISTTIVLKAGENKFDVNFGWDYQFLPPVNEACVDKPVFVTDVTIPDDTVIAPGTTFTKTWRIRNDGNCTWGPGLTLHSLYFTYGAQLGAPTEVPLPQNVPPGSTFDVSIEMIAPNDPGTYRSEWMFLKADGPLYGVGPDAQTPLAAQIIVRMQDTPPEIWQTYTNTLGLFSIRYPATDAFYENEIPSVDGVIAPVSNTIVIKINAPDPLLLSITFKPIESGTSPAAFARQDDPCVTKSRGDPTPGEPLEIGGQPALLFRDTMCGPNGSTVIYTTRGALGYRLAFPFVAPYEYVKGWVVPILDTFTMFGTTSAIQLPAS